MVLSTISRGMTMAGCGAAMSVKIEKQNYLYYGNMGFICCRLCRCYYAASQCKPDNPVSTLDPGGDLV